MRAKPRGYETFRGHVDEFTSDSTPAWTVTPTPRGPNVIVVLIDDLGFSDLGPFGSEIDTPIVDELAANGWVFSNYHTAPMCSPSRAALLTGLNPHRAGFGYVAHIDPGYPGFACELPTDAPTIAESLRAAGYATFMVGKWHLTSESKLHDGAEKSSWPLQRGFDRYFGSMDGFTSLHHPHRLISDNSPVAMPEFPDGYFLTDDLTAHAIEMIDELRTNDADKPFFLYFSHTSVHGPIQAKAVDIQKYRGRYEAGWERIRKERFARQEASGLVGPATELPPDTTPDAVGIGRWDDLGASDQLLFARHMEAYAAAVDEIDQSVGQLLSHLEQWGERDDTVVIVTSDNGGTAEGGPSGTRSYFAQFGVDTPLPDGWITDVPRDPELIGGPQLFSQYPAGWARVSNTPFRSFKSSSYEGGIHAPLVISWPNAPTEVNPGFRRQFVFVSDLAPTILELAGVRSLTTRNGAPAVSMDGHSFVAALSNPDAPSRQLQYFECVGTRALYRDGLKALSPVPPTKDQGAVGGEWELYDLRVDPTEIYDLAAERPAAVHELAMQWRNEAWRNTVFPLDDDGSLHTVRPSSEANLSSPVELRPFRPPLERFRSSRLTVLRSFRVDIELRTSRTTHGVVLAHGDQGGGYQLAVHNGRLQLAYNAYGLMHRATSALLTDGIHTISLMVDEQEELRCSLIVHLDGQAVVTIAGVPMLLGMAPFTGISVGYDYGSPVDWDLYTQHGSYRINDDALLSLRYVPGKRSRYDATVVRAIDSAVALLAD